VLLTGFNRRFSPFAVRLAELLAKRTNPLIINYRMNAGHIPLSHWVHGAEGGGRNLGEACHIYDLFTFLTGARVTTINAQAIRPHTGHYSASDNFVATMSFDDGSVATLTYTALGAKDYPKELMEVYSDGRVMVLDDYKSLSVHGAAVKGVSTPVQDKGQKAEVAAFVEAVAKGGEWPIPLWQQIQATEIAFAVESAISASAPDASRGASE
jgi:predicted dehydrogenase